MGVVWGYEKKELFSRKTPFFSVGDYGFEPQTLCL